MDLNATKKDVFKQRNVKQGLIVQKIIFAIPLLVHVCLLGNEKGQDPTGSNKKSQDPTGSNKKSQDPTGRNNKSQDLTGRNNKSQNPTGHNNKSQNPTGSNNNKSQNPTDQCLPSWIMTMADPLWIILDPWMTIQTQNLIG